MLNRREFLRITASTGALLAFPRLGWADDPTPQGTGKTLVLLHLRGGNDGLNTVIPYTDPRYRTLRPTLAVNRNQILEIDETLGLHPGLQGFRALWDRERLAIVNGVGYPRPNYSHFRSTEIWYTAQPDQSPTFGWIGRALDASASPSPLRAIALAKEAPLTLACESGGTATLTEFSRFRVPASLARVAELYGAYGRMNDGQRATVGKAGAEALDVAGRIARLQPSGGPSYGPLGNQLRKVVALLEADLPLEVIQLDFGGFDTHANQLGKHQQLLTQLGNNLNAFQQHVERLGLGERVVTIVFSEFGRRASENDSGGTDHGSAGPLFAIGSGVRPGFHGSYPSLTDLDRGNFKHTTDFRAVYAALLGPFLKADADAIVGDHPPLELFA